MSASEDAPPTGSPCSGNRMVIGQPGAGKTALHSTLRHQVTTQVFLPNPDARDDACRAALRLTDAEVRRCNTTPRCNTPKSA
jgi:Ni2+-binding GTPase involved in maturation of urease and hydrogenase